MKKEERLSLARGFLSVRYVRGQGIPGDSRVACDMQGQFAARARRHFNTDSLRRSEDNHRERSHYTQ